MPLHWPRSGPDLTRPPDEAEQARVRRKVGLRLREHRQRAGLTQTQVASVMHLSLSAISMWEQGNRELRYGSLLRLASLYGVSVGDFFEDEPSAATAADMRVLEARVASLERAMKT